MMNLHLSRRLFLKRAGAGTFGLASWAGLAGGGYGGVLKGRFVRRVPSIRM